MVLRLRVLCLLLSVAAACGRIGFSDVGGLDGGVTDGAAAFDATVGNCVNSTTQPCGSSVGQCSVGTQTCAAGSWGLCSGQGPGADDAICDGVDSDCDGLTDEDYPSVSSCGTGYCRATNTPSSCAAGVETLCSEGAPLGTGDVTCDGVDDNCNGVTDEDCPPWWDANWQRRIQLRFDNSLQTEDLLGFPVLVSVNGTRIDFARTQDAGQDIRFIDDDGATILAHEIDRWDESGTSFVWVRVPQIDGASSADHIWMYYGNVTALDSQNASGVWADFVAVWHLGEDPSGPPPQMRDSTANSYHAAANGTMVAMDQGPGQVGGSLNFDGVDDYLLVGGANVAPPWTATFFVARADSAAGSAGLLHTESCCAIGDFAIKMEQFDGTNRVGFTEFGVGDYTYGYEAPLGGTWTHLVLVGTATETTLYVNGRFEETITASIEVPLGQIASDTDLFAGKLDEVRVSTQTRSADWIAAQELSMMDNFILYSQEETF